MRLAGVLGSPVKHSKSPLIHNTWLKALNTKGLYVPLELKAQDLPSFIRMAPRLGFVGFNVTIPHKESVAHYCSEMSETARRAGSVNTIWFDEQGEALGDSTDGYGFLRNLQDKAQWSPAERKVAIFGAGGAARAVAAALLDGGAVEVRLTNRTADRADAIARSLGDRIKLFDWPGETDSGAIENFIDGADLIVNATSLGMEGGPRWTWRLPALGPDVVATDLIYAPLETSFLNAAKKQGAMAVDGLGMLLHQAAPGFKQWFGEWPTVTEDLREAILKGEGALP